MALPYRCILLARTPGTMKKIYPFEGNTSQLTSSTDRKAAEITAEITKRTAEGAIEMATAAKVASPAGSFFERFGVVFALVALYIIWGSTYLAIRVAIGSFPPYLMAGARFLLAGLLLYGVLRLRGTPPPTRAQWPGVVIVGTLLLAGGNAGVGFAEQWIATGVAAIAIAAVPLWTAFFVGLMGRWPTRVEWIGLGLGFAGVVLLNLGNNMWANPLGAFVLLLCPVCWAAGTALSGRVKLPSGLMSSASQMIVGGAASLVIGLLLGERMHSLPTVSSLEALAYLVIFGSLVAFCCFGYVIRKLRPALATSYAYVNPMVAVLLGLAFDGEHITLLGLVAMCVILTGVVLVSLGRAAHH
jgi:drug/metabolite transporter (DMT)-like permease